MMAQLRSLLSVPTMSTPLQQRQAILLHTLLVSISGIAVLSAPVTMAVAPDLFHLFTTIGFFTLIIGLLFALRAGHVRHSAIALVGLILVQFTLSSWVDGMQAGGALGMATGVLVAGLLLGGTAAAIVAILGGTSLIAVYSYSPASVPYPDNIIAGWGFLFIVIQVALLAAQDRSSRTTLLATQDRNARLRVSRGRHRAVAEHASLLIAELDANGTTLYANTRATAVLGEIPEMLVGAPFVESIHEDDRATFRAALDRSKTSHTPIRLQHRVHRRPDIRLSTAVGANPHGEGVRIVIWAQDMSEELHAREELSKAELKLRNAHRTEMLTRVAGGVAHEFNNLLTVIMSAASLAEACPDDPERVQRASDAILTATERATVLGRELLAFGKQQELTPERMDLSALVNGMNDIVGSMVGPTIRVAFDVPLGHYFVFADRRQIQQVLVNLVANARDAQPDGGTIHIAVARSDVLSDQLAADAGLIELTVRDDGEGIARKALPRIFEPFFTTRPDQAGLGLSTIHGIVAQSGGAVQVDSEPGKGAQFRVLLPEMAEKGG